MLEALHHNAGLYLGGFPASPGFNFYTHLFLLPVGVVRGCISVEHYKVVVVYVYEHMHICVHVFKGERVVK